MSAITPLMPRQPVPKTELPLVGGGNWNLGDEKPENFTLVVFYRGLHCPVCKAYLGDLNGRVADFEKLGVKVIAVSSDSKDRAAQAKADWNLDNLRVACGLSMDEARSWGLYVSESRNEQEPALFSEPGLFLVKPDGTLYFAATQTMPFARPAFAELLKGLEFVIAKDYPARGNVMDLPVAAE